MQHLLQEVNKFHEFEFVMFSDQMLLETPVEQWPSCEVLLCFHSSGFPIRRARRYQQRLEGCGLLRVSLQDLRVQKQVLLNREKVYSLLANLKVPVPCNNFIAVKRGRGHRFPSPTTKLWDTEDALFYSSSNSTVQQLVEKDYESGNGGENGGENGNGNGNVGESVPFHPLVKQRVDKPLVEKPIDANNHHIRIYYPKRGGCRTLFRKVDNKCSELHPQLNDGVRTKGSYIYEPLLTTVNHMDIKVYIVGCQADYVYAETRKSPAVSGDVERTSEGLEKRQRQVALTELELQICKKIALGFRQTVCGFDILRLGPNDSRVCDVNGFSMAKGYEPFFVNAGQVIRAQVLSAFQ